MKRIPFALAAALLSTQALAQTQFPANTLWGNPAASTGLPTTVPVTGCTTGQALSYTAGTGFSCVTAGGGSGGALAHTHLLVGNGSGTAADFGALATFADTGGLTINPTNGTSAAGLTINQAGPNSGSQGSTGIDYNSILVTDGLNLGSSAFTVGAKIQQNLQSNILGQKAALYVSSLRSTADTNTSGDQIGLVVIAQAAVSSGGTNTGAGAKGSIYGINPIISTYGPISGLTGAINYDIFAGGEVSVQIMTGSTAKRRIGWSIANADVGTGAVIDTAFEVASANATGSWKNALMFTQTRGAAALASTGTVIGSDGIAQTIANVISLPNWTVSNKIFDFTAAGFTVSGAGAVAATGLTLSNIATGTQCLHASSSGIVSGLGADCQVNLGYNGGAFIPFTSTAVAAAGTITSQTSTSSYIQMGKVVFMTIGVVITNVGSATGAVTVSLPVGLNCNNPNAFLSGRESGITGKQISGNCQATKLSLLNYDNTNVSLTTGSAYMLNGAYETP